MVWVGDRGLITQTLINQEFSAAQELDWMTALRGTQIRKLAEIEQAFRAYKTEDYGQVISVTFLTFRTSS